MLFRCALFEGMMVLPVLVVLAILVRVYSMDDLRSGSSARWSKWWHGGSSFTCFLYLNKRVMRDVGSCRTIIIDDW